MLCSSLAMSLLSYPFIFSGLIYCKTQVSIVSFILKKIIFFFLFPFISLSLSSLSPSLSLSSCLSTRWERRLVCFAPVQAERLIVHTCEASVA